MKQISKFRYSSNILDCLLLVALVALIYWRTLGYDFQTSWDDNWYVIYNESIRGFSWDNLRTIFTSISQANYAPIQILSYAVDYSIWGLNPGGYHLTNIILHTLNGLLLYYLFNRWHGNRLFSFVASACYLVHPLQVENVAWISDRKNLLSIFFFLSAWEGYCRYREEEGNYARFYYWGSVAAFLLSLMSKSTTLVLPLILVGYDLCFPDAGRRLRIKDKVPYLLAAVVFAAVSMHVQTSDFQGGIRIPYHGGSPFATLLTMVPVFCRYIWMVIWPVGLSAVYAPPVYTTANYIVMASFLLIAVVMWGGARLFKVDRTLGFWFVFFWIGLLPYAQIVPIMWLMFDRYMNVSIIGVSALAGAAAVALRSRLGDKRAVFSYGVVAIWIVLLGGVSFQQVGVWRDSLTLFRDAAEKSPGSAHSWRLLGNAYSLAGQTDDARRAFERGLQINPLDTDILSGLGAIYTAAGELEKGGALLDKLLKLKPTHVIGWSSMGQNYQKQGRYDDAERAFLQALKLQPDAMPVIFMLGDLERVRGNLERSRNYYMQVDEKGWTQPEIAYGLACVEAMAGNHSAALNWLEKALQHGFSDFSTLYQDKQLASLRGTPRFIELMQRYGAKQ